MVVSNLVEAIVSIKRISSFLDSDELQTDARDVVLKEGIQEGDEVLSIANGEFFWSKDKPLAKGKPRDRPIAFPPGDSGCCVNGHPCRDRGNPNRERVAASSADGESVPESLVPDLPSHPASCPPPSSRYTKTLIPHGTLPHFVRKTLTELNNPS